MPEVQSLTSMPTRLKAVAANVREAKLGYDLAVKLRNAVVVQAVDEGMAQQEVAKLIGAHKSHVTRILADSQPDTDEE